MLIHHEELPQLSVIHNNDLYVWAYATTKEEAAEALTEAKAEEVRAAAINYPPPLDQGWRIAPADDYIGLVHDQGWDGGRDSMSPGQSRRTMG